MREEHFRRMAVAVLSGSISGLLAFTSTSMLLFALGSSWSQVVGGAVFGVVSGFLSGPVFCLLRVPARRAAVLESSVLGAIYTLYVLQLLRGTIFPTPVHALGFLLIGLTFVVVSSALAAAGTVGLYRFTMSILLDEGDTSGAATA